MTRQLRPRPPDLAADGADLWDDTDAWLSEHKLRLDPHELRLLAELCRQLDRIATLRDALARMGATEPAWTRLATEERMGRIAFGRMVSQLGLPTGTVPEVPSADGRIIGLSPNSRRAIKASRTRWGVRHAS